MNEIKNIKEKMDSVKEESLKLIGIYFIVILITFITVILVYFIGLYRYKNSNNFEEQRFELKTIVNDYEYGLLSLDEVNNLSDKCINNCKIKTGDENYTYYTINKDGDSYVVNIDLLYKHLGEYNLGNDISNLTLRKYLGYDTLSITIHNEVRSFDEVIVVSSNKNDVFISFNASEVEFTDNGIIYYTYSCLRNNLTNAVKIKNIRKPFSETNDIISMDYINMNMC